MGLLNNPERAWSAAVQPTIDRDEVVRRIGKTSASIEVLAGGFANLNVRVGDDRVLRIMRDQAALAKERSLLQRCWKSFRTPLVLEAGDDFLLLEHLDLRPLVDSVGGLVGCALAEIHGVRYPTTGFLAADLSLAKPFPPDGFVGVEGYIRAMLEEAEPFLGPTLPASIRAYACSIEQDAIEASDGPVLSHCDFKVGNLHLSSAGELVVLDWEFAWAGPRLLDVGQVLRWQPPEPFVTDFARAYVAAGGFLADGWRRVATAFDLGHMLGVYAHNAIMRSTDDIPRRIADTIRAA
jgi:hypothetical protein